MKEPAHKGTSNEIVDSEPAALAPTITQTLIEQYPAAIALFDLRGTFFDCNRPFGAAFSRRPDQCRPGPEWLALLPNAWRLRSARGWTKVREKATFNDHEAVVRLPNGESKVLTVSGKMVQKYGCTNGLFLVTVTDVTPLVQRIDRMHRTNSKNKARIAYLSTQLQAKSEQLHSTLRKVDSLTADVNRLKEATRLLMDGFEAQKKSMEQRIITNFHIAALPLLEELRKTTLTPSQQYFVETLQFVIGHITSYFGMELGSTRSRLSAREIDICRLIDQGKDSREIASDRGLSYQTVIVHRKNIRKKLGIKRSKQNLAAFIRENF